MKLFKRKMIGLDFPDYSIEVAEIEAYKGRPYLRSFNRTIISEDIIKNGEIKNEDEFKNIIKKLLLNSNPKTIYTKDVSIIFPSSKVITHIFTFPATLSESEILKAIPFQAETVIPYAMEDIYFDYSILKKDNPKHQHASQEVLFACITKDIADKYVNILESLGLHPQTCSISPEVLKYAMSPLLELDKKSIIIDIDTLATNYMITDGRILKYFFSTNDGGSKILSILSEEFGYTADHLIKMIETKSIGKIAQSTKLADFHTKNYKRASMIVEEQVAKGRIDKIDTVILTGKFLNLPGFFRNAQKFFPNQKIVIGDPKSSLQIDPTKFAPLDNRDGQSVPYSIYFTNAIGVTLQGLCRIHRACDTINLLPDRLKNSIADKKTALITAIISLAMTALSMFVATSLTFTHQKFSFERKNLNTVKSAVENVIYGTRYQDVIKEINIFNSELDSLIQIDRQLFSIPDVLNNINNLLPKGITTSVMSFNHNDISLEIEGVAENRNILLEMKKNLEAAEFIEDLIAPISNFDQKTKISFTIKIYLNRSKLTKYGSFTNTK